MDLHRDLTQLPQHTLLPTSPRRRRRRTPALLTAVIGTVLATVAVAPAATAATDSVVIVVLDPTGHPVPGVVVRSTEATNPGFTATTNANGRVTVDDLQGTSAGACASLRQDQQLGGTAGWYDACAGFEVGSTTKVVLRFRPGAAVGGVVTDARTGAPVPGATVSLFASTGSEPDDFLTTSTDESGHYLYRNLEPRLLTQLGATAGSSTAAPYGYAADPPASHLATPVPLQAGTVRTDLSLRLTPNVRWGGTVIEATQLRVPNALVAVGDPAEGNQPATFTIVTADASGSFALLRPWDAGARLCVWSRASAAHPTGLAAVCSDVTTTGLRVARRVLLPTEGGTFTGSIVRKNGQPLPGRTLSVTALTAAGLPLPGVVAADGTYRIDGLPALTTRVRAADTTGAVAYSGQARVAAGAVTAVPSIVLAPAS